MYVRLNFHFGKVVIFIKILRPHLHYQGHVTTSNLLTLSYEGPEKATKGGGVNGSQSKFLTGTWPISQNQPETPLF
jgi:hypothetical protein